MITKTCKKHGVLPPELIHKKGLTSAGNQHYGCTLCKRENAKRYKANHPDRVKEQQRNRDQKKKDDPAWKEKRSKWDSAYKIRKRERDGDKLREIDRSWQAKLRARNPEKYLAIQQKMRDELHDSYIRDHLAKSYGFEKPSDDLIGAKREIIRLKREIIRVRKDKGAKGENSLQKLRKRFRRKDKREGLNARKSGTNCSNNTKETNQDSTND